MLEYVVGIVYGVCEGNVYGGIICCGVCEGKVFVGDRGSWSAACDKHAG